MIVFVVQLVFNNVLMNAHVSVFVGFVTVLSVRLCAVLN